MENICLICGFNELYDPPYDEKGGLQTKSALVVVFILDLMMMMFKIKKLYMSSGEVNGYKMEVNGFQRAGNPMKIGM